MRKESIASYNERFRKRISLGQLARMAEHHSLSRTKETILEELFLSTSHDCNADCVHCYEKFGHPKFRRSLSTAQAKSVIDQFVELHGCQIFFCSGEFLLRKDALELVAYARARDLLTNVTSNGLLLDAAMIDALDAAGLTRLIVSVDSADAARHDRLRGVKGCLDKVKNAVRLAKRKGIMADIWTYVSRSNAEELAGISKLAEEIGADCIFVFFPILSGNLLNKREEGLTLKERMRFRRRFNASHNVVLEFPAEKDLCRGGGNHHLCVMPSGDVTFCPPVPYSYGHIDKRSLRDCLLDMRADYKRLKRCCRGQCPVNSLEYRKRCSAKFMYPSEPA
ncbi:MAG: radical SAM protein [Elusimicrobiota bacterium]|jgi:MoaA/NifB/PqqE/SkfB family radical SAM enzyme